MRRLAKAFDGRRCVHYKIINFFLIARSECFGESVCLRILVKAVTDRRNLDYRLKY